MRRSIGLLGFFVALTAIGCPKKRTALDSAPPSQILLGVPKEIVETEQWTSAVEQSNARVQPAARLEIPTSTVGTAFGGAVITLFGPFDAFVTKLRRFYPVIVVRRSPESKYVSVGFIEPRSIGVPSQHQLQPISQPCTTDEECVATTFPGCCERCPLPTYAWTKRQLEAQMARCEVMDCSSVERECPPVSRHEPRQAGCREGKCVLVP